MIKLIEKLIESIKSFIRKFTKKKTANPIKSSGPGFVNRGDETEPKNPQGSAPLKAPENAEPVTEEAYTFGNDILEELKNDRTLQLEEEYGILKVLEDDVSVSDLATELNETLALLNNKKAQQQRIIVQYRYSIYLTNSR
ncbi:hypothetical protein ACSAZK_15145 [Methanosarcina sp. Mfa9]|uniref:hypothetical protein n=1 Tax=Methanosarcina sp. Mfa9 TaxID=3439063 RepID=UPI003F837CE5